MKVRNGFVSNSSSSCFICGINGENKYNIEETIAILHKIIKFYNDLENLNLSFEDVFEIPKYGTEIDLDLFSDYYNEEQRELDIKLMGYYDYHFLSFIKEKDAAKEKIKKLLLIYSAEDNSIPYILFELIEEKFNARRLHLGLIMKFRNGFVSNSSSSSFVISKAALTKEQIDKLLEYTDSKENNDGWNISEEEYFIKGWTHMDNEEISSFIA